MKRLLLLIMPLALALNAESQPYEAQRQLGAGSGIYQQANTSQDMARGQCAPYRNPALNSHVDALCKGKFIQAL